MITVLIVDDEPPARRKLHRLLEADERVAVVGEAGDGVSAVEKIEAANPELVFLDIQMPGMNGFEVVEALGSGRPKVVFVTAYDEYAVQAFEVRALDYLLKPVEESRLREAVGRAIADGRSTGERDKGIEGLLKELRERQPFLKRVLVRLPGRIFSIETRRIGRFEAEEKYVRVHAEGKSYLLRQTMNELEDLLDPGVFVRVHRGEIVNMGQIRELQLGTHGDYEILLQDGSRVALGRTFRSRFFSRFTGSPGADKSS